MEIISWNVNGIRAAERNGFQAWFESVQGDIVCLQEVKAVKEQVSSYLLTPSHPKGVFKSHWFSAKKPGYSGVVTYALIAPLEVRRGFLEAGLHQSEFDQTFDDEGRVLVTEFERTFVINAYFPNSQRDHARLDYKVRFCNAMLKLMQRLEKKNKAVVLCGDLNIAHRELDLKNPKTNIDNAGFLPEERAWLDRVEKMGWVDTFRIFEKSGGHYTWWSYRPGVREKNIGWRLDYHWVDPGSRELIEKCWITPEIKGSDHCPVHLKITDAI